MSFANEFRIHGNLVNDVRRGRTGGGVTTAFYVVAVDHQFRSGDNIQTTTDFIPITTYGKQAESDLKYLAKGKEVAMRGGSVALLIKRRKLAENGAAPLTLDGPLLPSQKIGRRTTSPRRRRSRTDLCGSCESAQFQPAPNWRTGTI